jgi:hypothetical protein
MPGNGIVTALPAIAVPAVANGVPFANVDYQHQGIPQNGTKNHR